MIFNPVILQNASGDISLAALTILTPPDKVDYVYNSFNTEDFDPTGMTLQVTLEAFGSEIIAPIGVDRVTITPDNLSPDTTTMVLSLSFGGQVVTATQPITVSHRGPTWADIESVDMTWAMMESQFDSWADFESA